LMVEAVEQKQQREQQPRLTFQPRMQASYNLFFFFFKT
jgi:hypothetical protein